MRLKLGGYAILALSIATPSIGQAQTAHETGFHEEKAHLPPPIYAAYLKMEEAEFYVCPEPYHNKIEKILDRDYSVIRAKFYDKFAMLAADEPTFLPTHCPSPSEYPDYEERADHRLIAVRHFDHVVQASANLGIRRP